MTDYGTLIPVNVVTGFLGSGKTTLLQRLLAAPRLSRAAVLVNEFGEVGLDHQLLQHVSESTLLLDNGCLCCAMRGDVQGALKDLFSRRERGEVPRFERVVIETSGLADPVPIAYTLLAEPVLQHHFRLGAIVTTVDAVNAPAQLGAHPETAKQIAVADRLVLTKTDLAAPQEVAGLKARLRQLNAAAPLTVSGADPVDPVALLVEDLHDDGSRGQEVARWLAALDERVSPHDHSHSEDVSSFCLKFDQPLDWSAFGVWLSMLLHRHGDRVLRVKGLLHVRGVATPVLINGVQHIVHPPTHLEAWPDGDRSSRLIFIVQGLARQRIEQSLDVFNRLSNPPAAGVRRSSA